MLTEAWAAIIAAVITGLFTLLATKYDDLKRLVTRASRDISGDWTVQSERFHDGNWSWIGDYDLKIEQKGIRITGEMRATKVKEGMPLCTYKWTGTIHSEYLVYECINMAGGAFMISSGNLYLHADGRTIEGYFVANSGARSNERTWVGRTMIRRK